MSACASRVPEGSYGVAALEFQGTQKVEASAIAACLATHAREHVGENPPECGVPPFDEAPPGVELWVWPWTEWPIFNATAFERDVERVERFYRARGHYDARVTHVSVQRLPEEREVHLSMTVEEGDPVLIVRLDIEGIAELDTATQRALLEALQLERGEPFDEAYYEGSRRAMLAVLRENSYARADIRGDIEVDPAKRMARVRFDVSPGPRCRFGEVRVEGNDDLPDKPIVAAADIRRDAPFSLSAMTDARRAVFALGPFASVEVDEQVHEDDAVVDVIVRVVPARRLRYGVGVGMEVGGIYSQDGEGVGDSFNQWDVHLLGKIEHKNFLGGMRRLRIEERPRLIFDDPFPSTARAEIGNRLTLELRQPSFLEARTTLVGRAQWDRGPDPYGGRYLRHDIVAGIGPERAFFGGLLHLSTSINVDVFRPDQQYPYPDFEFPYFQHRARIDRRDDPRNTTRGTYFALGLQHSGYLLSSDWEYLRASGDARGYLPLPASMVLAGRVRVGWLNIGDTDIAVADEPGGCDATPLGGALETECNQYAYSDDLARFGPLRHRLRGGGQNSVRGYEPNTLGDVSMVDGRLLSGGLRQWEASLELRVPLVSELWGAAFIDVGDVSRSEQYRLDHPHTSFGLGLRLRTLVGPLRVDVATAPQGLQTLGKEEVRPEGLPRPQLLGFKDVTLHFSIGEAF
ncbi:MAG: BamA/TamA family outer membrane protein [Myxococcales bacterium]|nr:BamA/TamA family outer membrane protein [Myxococcales bacterium]